MERRVFLTTAVGLATCATACSSSTTAGTPAHGPVDGGNLKDVPIGTLRAIANQPVILGRDAAGLYAMSAICTHQQCDITESGSILATSIVCSCHGSRFDLNGAVKVGPASSPLDHYSVTLASDGAITVHADKLVPLSTRTPAPT
jgi:Rieske Fe-S protein